MIRRQLKFNITTKKLNIPLKIKKKNHYSKNIVKITAKHSAI